MINNTVEKIEMKGLSGESLNILEEKINKIKEIFPEVICEGKIDFERLGEELGEFKEDKEERYRFEWAGKSEAIKISQTSSLGTLRPCKEESKDWDTTQNVYIEGDNLEVLKLLQKSYQNKIKMIYIDPPYNRKNAKDLIYKDNYQDNIKNYLKITGQLDEEVKNIYSNVEKDGKYHMRWLNMIYPRIKIARDLLNEDGVLFISIDENEVTNLKKICDEIFGEDNFIETFMWTKTSTPPSLSNKSRKTVEYILCYEKFKNNSKYRGELLDNGDAPLLNSGNKLAVLEFPPYTIKFKISDGVYKKSNYEKVELLDDLLVENSWNKNAIRLKGEFKWTQQTLNDEILKKTYFLIKSLKFSIRFQRVLADETYKAPTNFIYDKQMNIELNSKENISTNEIGGKELEDLNLKNAFDYTKPTSLIEYLINFTTNKNDLILDFFSGSGTTAQAVINQNLKNNYTRKFILVQLPENLEEISEFKNICEIGKERIRRAGDKTVAENKDKEGIEDLDIGFKVFKLDSTNIKKWDPSNKNELHDQLSYMQDSFVDGRTEEDILYELMLKAGIDITYEVEVIEFNDKKIFNVGVGELIVCLSDVIDASVAEEIVKHKNERTRVIFRESGFKDDSTKINVLNILGTHKIKEVMSI